MTPLVVFLTEAFLWSFAAGTFGAMLGLGGGAIIVPALTLALGVDIRYAIGAAIVAVIATSCSGAVSCLREHMSNIRVGMFLEMATVTGALTGAFLSGIVHPRSLYIIFAVVIGYSALVMFRRRGHELPDEIPMGRWARFLHMEGEYYDPSIPRLVPYNVKGARVALPLMYVAGIVSGLLGIGSGILKVPAMDIAMHLPIKVSTATSNFMIGVTAAASAGVYFARGDINPVIAAPVALGVVCGSMVGVRLMVRAKNTNLRKIFVAVLVAVSAQMLLKGCGISFR